MSALSDRARAFDLALADEQRRRLERIRIAAQDALDTGSATGSGTTLAQRILSILEGT